MRILKVEPREVYISMEFSYHEMCLLKAGLEVTELNLDVNTEAGSKIESFMINILYPTVSKLLSELDGDDFGTNPE